VLALFTEDCVLLPPHAAKPRLGHQGLNEFWFPPDAPQTEITKLVVTIQGVGGDGHIAYTWGTDEVAWTTLQDNKKTASSHTGIFLNVLQKQSDGSWKISHHMWDDALSPR
jgi:ketosteroid isomerase-like protein